MKATTPDPTQDVELLRALAVTRGIDVVAISEETTVAAALAARLWCGVCRASSLEYSARYGLPANETASSILALAAGSKIKRVAKPTGLDEPSRSSQRSINVSEQVLELWSDLLGTQARKAKIMALVSRTLSIGAGDHRIAAAIDVVEASATL
jgi:hypothetical protein